MAVDFYDVAVTSKIKKLFSNTVFQNRELTFKTITDKSSEVKFPLVSIFRPDGWSINVEGSTWAETTKFLNGIHQVPVSLVYVIDVYANTREDLEQFTAELVLYLLRNKGVQVIYKSADASVDLSVKTTLDYVSGPERTSELDDKTVGRPYRYTLTYKINDAYIFEFAGSEPGKEGYVPQVTQVIVDVLPVVEVQTTVGVEGEDNTHKSEYIDKEEYYGKN